MIRVLVIGLGNMGMSHALAYQASPEFELVGLVARSRPDLPEVLKDVPFSNDFQSLMATLEPDLVQQSHGAEGEVHKALMQSTSPIVDCGVHYVDVMCQITDARPREVRGMGLRLTDEIAPDMYNYGHFQVLFDDGSVGWYEAAWGPMISETAYFVKDVIAPAGAVSIVAAEQGGSSSIDSHTRVGTLKVHREGGDRLIDLPDEPGHQALCNAEADLVADAITNDRDLTRHMRDALTSLAICLAADQSVRTGQPVTL